MATVTQVQLRRGTSAQVATFTGAQGEVVVDTTNNRAVVHDGATAGGFALARRAEKQRAIHGSADLPVTADDVILNVNVTSPLTITVPAASSRALDACSQAPRSSTQASIPMWRGRSPQTLQSLRNIARARSSPAPAR